MFYEKGWGNAVISFCKLICTAIGGEKEWRADKKEKFLGDSEKLGGVIFSINYLIS